MPIGLNNITTISMQNITDITNVSNPMEIIINVNNIVYDGYLYFVLLLTFWIILAIVNYKKNNGETIIRDIMYTGAFITILSFFLRSIYIVELGVVKGLITDKLMWIFPLVTILIATFLKITDNK